MRLFSDFQMVLNRPNTIPFYVLSPFISTDTLLKLDDGGFFLELITDIEMLTGKNGFYS